MPKAVATAGVVFQAQLYVEAKLVFKVPAKRIFDLTEANVPVEVEQTVPLSCAVNKYELAGAAEALLTAFVV